MQLLFLGDLALTDENMSEWQWEVPGGIHPGDDQKILFNWEFPLGDAINPVRRSSGSRHLAKPAAVQVIRSWAPGIAALATNHILDGDQEGLKTTIAALRNAGFETVGGGLTPEEIEKPFIWETEEGRLAVINWVFPETHPDLCASTGPNCWPGMENAVLAVQSLKRQVDWVVLFLHWSDELFAYPLLTDRQTARQLVNAGADMIIGNHSHVVRGFETIASCPVFYSIGNFFFSSRKDPWNDRSILQSPRSREAVGVLTTFRRGKPPAFEVLSFWREREKVILDPKNRAAKRMAQTSRVLAQYDNAAYENWYAKQRKWFNVLGYRVNFKLWQLSTQELFRYLFKPVRGRLPGDKTARQVSPARENIGEGSK